MMKNDEHFGLLSKDGFVTFPRRSRKDMGPSKNTRTTRDVTV